MKLWTTLIGGIAACGTTLAWLPQVIKTWKTRSAEDFSWSYMALFSTGVACWLVYGFLKKEIPIIVWNVASLLLAGSIVTMKLKFR